MTDCVFCKIISGELPSHKVYEDDRVLAFLDIRPLNPGHTLIVSKVHADNWLANGEEDALAVTTAARRLAPAIMRAVGAPACHVTSNVGPEAGQIVIHTHFHIIPRHTDDGYKPWHRNVDESKDPATIAQSIRDALSA